MTKPALTTKDIPYIIGSDTLPGLSKFIEETGEANQVVGKIQGCGHMEEHWDGKGPLKERLEDEMADIIASITYIADTNDLDMDRMEERTRVKLQTFIRWDKNIQAGRDPNDDGEV